ncbi:molybdopterin-dependent oxidoreductase [Microvirga rosea]|uniref:molybdopterin-dependent oxidoreductase n=1 Tax=Microvirga rosea TaxID=2715425 RepID=UPI001D09B307|nr:molybdopterin-dependent oxidoreductase [Microvirga rosea]MCB8819376.1 molybdopterin-dependent oxidoreductase [Microvirga rosea]
MSAAKSKQSIILAFLSLLTLAFSGIAMADPLAAPTEKPILTIGGNISVTNKAGEAQFDRPMLEALGLVTIETTTPWYTGPVKFEGVPLDKLMKLVGASGERAAVVALNDYSSEIPIADFAKYNVILALKRNGEYMPVKDKGPLFVIYPFDSLPELKSQTYYGRAVWQVAKIIIK